MITYKCTNYAQHDHVEINLDLGEEKNLAHIFYLFHWEDNDSAN